EAPDLPPAFPGISEQLSNRNTGRAGLASTRSAIADMSWMTYHACRSCGPTARLVARRDPQPTVLDRRESRSGRVASSIACPADRGQSRQVAALPEGY